MKKLPFTYSILCLVLMLSGAVFTCFLLRENQHAQLQGYKISFAYGCTHWEPSRRIYQTYTFNGNSVHNDSTMFALQENLDMIRQSYDSIHGIDAIFTNDTPYEYYLKTVAVCYDHAPKKFFPYEDHIYASGMSRFRLREDSVFMAENERYSAPQLILK